MRTVILAFLVASCLPACANEYHPEYHPVTVSNVEQNYSSPVYVAGAARPVVVGPAPSQQQPIVLGPMTPEPPPGFFDR